MFHLNFKPETSSVKINHQQGILFIGSCFSEHISNKLFDLKFHSLSNPLGIVFNPKSIYKTLLNAIHQTKISDLHFIQRENHWFCLEAHSKLFSNQKLTLVNDLSKKISEWQNQLKSAKWLVITFGSAYCYEYIKTKSIISNCQKISSNEFNKQLLSSTDIVSDFDFLIHELKKMNPNLNIIFSVSPVKNLRDGIIENTLSKSILIQSVHSLIGKHSNCFYFPSYELITDDLRDYRFYKEDMAHPNRQAIDYVFEKFSDVYFTAETKKINEQLSEINSAHQHQALNVYSTSYKIFKQKFLLKCERLLNQYPFLDLQKELNYFSN